MREVAAGVVERDEGGARINGAATGVNCCGWPRRKAQKMVDSYGGSVVWQGVGSCWMVERSGREGI